MAKYIADPIRTYETKLEGLFKMVDHANYDPSIVANWARYLCVLVSGYVEVSLRHLLSEYVGQRAQPPIVKYVETHLSRLTNLKMSKIYAALEPFNKSWQGRLQAALSEKTTAQIDSLVNTRNAISHGVNTGIGFVTVRQYYDSAQELVNALEEIILGEDDET